jgi:hypothetical protein
MMGALTLRRPGMCIALGAAVLAATLVLGVHRAQAGADPAAAWPEVDLPPDVQAYSISPRMTVDDTPTELNGFDSTRRPAELAGWFRTHLPQPVLEDRLGDKLILGHPSGAYYITITLEQAGEGTRGVVSVMDLQGAWRLRAAGGTITQHLLAGFPSGTKVVRSMSSTENARSATFVALVNRYDEQVNREHLVELLLADGLRLESEAQADPATVAELPDGMAVGSTLFFKGRGKEAIAVITRGADGQATVVLNTITTMEQYQ